MPRAPDATTLLIFSLCRVKDFPSPGFLGCKTRGSNFWSMQKFVPKLQKLWYLLHWLDQLFLGKSKIFLQKTYSVGSPAIAIKMQKNYPIMQKFLHDHSKTTFCSIENPGYCSQPSLWTNFIFLFKVFIQMSTKSSDIRAMEPKFLGQCLLAQKHHHFM